MSRKASIRELRGHGERTEKNEHAETNEHLRRHVEGKVHSGREPLEGGDATIDALVELVGHAQCPDLAHKIGGLGDRRPETDGLISDQSGHPSRPTQHRTQQHDGKGPEDEEDDRRDRVKEQGRDHEHREAERGVESAGEMRDDGSGDLAALTGQLMNV